MPNDSWCYQTFNQFIDQIDLFSVQRQIHWKTHIIQSLINKLSDPGSELVGLEEPLNNMIRNNVRFFY